MLTIYIGICTHEVEKSALFESQVMLNMKKRLRNYNFGKLLQNWIVNCNKIQTLADLYLAFSKN